MKRLVWIQFEGYLPSRPDAHYTYDLPRHVQAGGKDFFANSYARGPADTVRAGSDREHVEALLRAHDFAIPPGVLYVRLVHLTDAQKRRELMIIYGEKLEGALPKADGAARPGTGPELPPDIGEPLIRRALAALSVTN